MRVAVNALGTDHARGSGEEHFLRRSLLALSKLSAPVELVVLTTEQTHSIYDGLERVCLDFPEKFAQAVSDTEADVLFTSVYGPPGPNHVPRIAFAMELYELRKRASKRRLIGPSPIRQAAELAHDTHAFVVPSEFMRRELLDVLNIPLDRSVVAPLGVDESFANDQACIVEQPYLLHVGRISDRKNLPVLLDAFKRVKDEMDHNLVLVGQPGENEPEHWGDRIVRIDRVGTAQLTGLYKHSELVICASTYEGSGVISLEALKSGARVAVGRVGGVPEVSGDAPFYFNPESVDSLVGVIRRARSEGPNEIARRQQAAGQIARGYTWERTARQLLTAFRRAIA